MANRKSLIIKISQIVVEGRKRELNTAKVKSLAQSIREIGLLQPIVVTRQRKHFRLVAGLHRLEACQALGWIQIPAQVVALDDLHAELAEIDENLERTSLTELEQALLVARRKEIYLALHPETRRGLAGAKAKHAGRANENFSFANDTAQRAGVDQRTIQLQAQIGRELAEHADELRGTAIENNHGELLKLARMGSDLRRHVIQRVREHHEPVSEAKRAVIREMPTTPVAIEPLSDPCITVYDRDARELAQFVTPDVGLVFTSPPYNVGMPYSIHNDALPEAEYAALIQKVLRECYQVMLDGARIGIVVAFGVGRDPWQPLATRIAEWLNAAHFTLFGQVVWDKGMKKAATMTSWGSYRHASAPRFRDRTEAIVWAYKKAPTLAIPDEHILRDETGTHTPFLADGDLFRTLTQDVWSISPDSSSHVEHPATFPVELAERAIQLFGYPGMHVLDPFCGIGTTLVAAKKWGCRGTGVDLDSTYCAIARRRIQEL